MALAEATRLQDRRPSAALTLDLPSNNPFRNRAASPASSSSPALPSPRSVHSNPPERPLSRNPFLANFEEDKFRPPQPPRESHSPRRSMAVTGRQSPPKLTLGANAQELFDNLVLDDRSPPTNSNASSGAVAARPPPPQRSGTLPINGIQPQRRPKDERRLPNGLRRPSRPRGPAGEPNIFASPDKGDSRPRRRNSESSVIDKGLSPEDERRRRERRREREARSKDGKSRTGRAHKPKGIDLIDKLDVTGIYGSGLFHHDGPFDACNPHRNRRKDHRAPMEAFPAGSANNAVGGSGPLNKNIDLEKFHGRGAEGFTDYNKSANDGYDAFGKRHPMERSMSFNPIQPVQPVHGEESVGLGTSTFLEGAPASRTAIQRRQSENESSGFQGAGIARKKSLAQRIRGMSQPRRGDPQGLISPRANSVVSPDGPLARGGVQSAGGVAKLGERNPFFEDYDEAYDKKGATITAAETDAPDGNMETSVTSRPRAASSPKGNHARIATTEYVSDDGIAASNSNGNSNGTTAGGGGFLSRVKSLKGGKRTRPDRSGS